MDLLNEASSDEILYCTIMYCTVHALQLQKQNKLQETLGVEPCVKLDRESDLSQACLITDVRVRSGYLHWTFSSVYNNIWRYLNFIFCQSLPHEPHHEAQLPPINKSIPILNSIMDNIFISSNYTQKHSTYSIKHSKCLSVEMKDERENKLKRQVLSLVLI